MATPKQRRANSANAKKSTGPKTDKGKEASSCNALTHGAYAQPCTLLAEERDTWNEVRMAAIEDLAPVGMVRSAYAEGIAWTLWRLSRLRTKEGALMALIDARTELGLLEGQMQSRWQRATKAQPSEAEMIATDEEIAQRDSMEHEIQALEAMTGRPASEIEERFDRYAAAEVRLQRMLQNQLAIYYGLKNRK
jgi:hypothetical protein